MNEQLQRQNVRNTKLSIIQELVDKCHRLCFVAVWREFLKLLNYFWHYCLLFCMMFLQMFVLLLQRYCKLCVRQFPLRQVAQTVATSINVMLIKSKFVKKILAFSFFFHRYPIQCFCQVSDPYRYQNPPWSQREITKISSDAVESHCRQRSAFPFVAFKVVCLWIGTFLCFVTVAVHLWWPSLCFLLDWQGDSKAGFVDIILNVQKGSVRVQNSFFFCFLSTAVTFICNGNRMILTQGAIRSEAPLIWQTFTVSFITFPVINPQVFQVYRRNYHTTKPAIWKRNKSGFFLHRYLNHSQSIKLDPHDFDFCSVLTSRGLSPSWLPVA